MATKTISITTEAYEFLKKLKSGRSFSETILSLKVGKDDIMNFAGALKDVDLDSVEKIRKEWNREWEER